jgi:8-oxo-dGTP pyrophosphatase MutT (NUDIX family)
MSYLRPLEACNRFDPERFLPLLLEGRRVGFVRRDNARSLEAFPRIFRVSTDAITLADTIHGPEAATEALSEATDALIRAGAVKRRRNERFAITDGWGGPLLFELDRGMVEFFGVPAYAVQLNGWQPGDDGPDFWIAKRAKTKATFPGKLDNMVAGGIGAGYNARQTLLKEAGEEAGVPEALAMRAQATGAIRFRTEMAEGMRDEVLFIYDLQVPADFTPRNMDGEVEDFRLLSVKECLRLVRETDQFMYDVNLVVIDFGLRHGLLTPEEPGYLALVDGLRGGLVRGRR